jgi:hypothetical protein
LLPVAKPKIGEWKLNKQALYEKLELEAGRGATLTDLDAEIDKASQRLTDIERGEAWLYAWALVKCHETRLLMAMRNGDSDDGA